MQPEVLVEEREGARILTLNRPWKLNALSLQMVTQLLKFFYVNNPKIKLVIMKGEGRAFCAGGDVEATVLSAIKDGWRAGMDILRNLFTLSYLIATYSKPQVSILNGIVMGGGAGVSIHGKFRVATENSVFAMPEAAFGGFPDVGSSYFLSRLPGYFGEYVGLTGARLDGTEMLACGLATHFVPSKVLPLLEESLIRVGTSDSSAICMIIDEFSQRVPLTETSAYTRLDIVDRCFSKGTVEEVIIALEEETTSHSDHWIRTAIRSLKKASPSSLKIALRLIREGRFQGIRQCIVKEYRMCCHLFRKDVSMDLYEGFRAIFVDKDNNPKWEPSKLEQVTNEMVNQYFTKVDDVGWEDLRLPFRQNSNLSKM